MAKNGKLLYHLTALENLKSIFQNGLQSRATLAENGFIDIADCEIIDSRQQHSLEQYVPFHFFAKNPFDYGVQRTYPNKDFVLITVKRSVAKTNNWKIIPRHPLAEEGYEILDYDEGIDAIDWALINHKNYDDRACKVACMAECLSPSCVLTGTMHCIYVKTDEILEHAKQLAHKTNVSCYINLAVPMFAGDPRV